MKFEVDNQTLKDLEIFETIKDGKSVFGLFNFTQCLGGRNRLHHMLRNPLTDIEKINDRKEAIEFFQSHDLSLNLDKDALDFTEYYFRHGISLSKPPSKLLAIERKLMDKINPNNNYYLIEKGVKSTIGLLKNIYNFSIYIDKLLTDNNSPKLLIKNTEEVLEIFERPEYSEVISLNKIKAYDTAKFDYLFRHTDRKTIYYFLDLVYEYDVFMAVAKAAKTHNFVFPEIVPEIGSCLKVEGLFHPFVNHATPSDAFFGSPSNLMFISGPNMAGKSTFLKALGIAAYLAHTGFPVPASKMKISILSGLCTTINISDNLNSGYSHFYAEVMRIKEITEKLINNNNMLVIFDELFRGTNVKDAYDGTYAIVSALSEIKTSFFVVSSHIVEVAKELETKQNIKFAYFEVLEDNGFPIYTYKLKEGISDIRLGMYIINKENLIELIKSINK